MDLQSKFVRYTSQKFDPKDTNIVRGRFGLRLKRFLIAEDVSKAWHVFFFFGISVFEKIDAQGAVNPRLVSIEVVPSSTWIVNWNVILHNATRAYIKPKNNFLHQICIRYKSKIKLSLKMNEKGFRGSSKHLTDYATPETTKMQPLLRNLLVI